MNFSENLMALRRSRNWSQEELGEKLGVTRQTISKWELGQTTPELEKLVELARLFERNLDDLVGNASRDFDHSAQQGGGKPPFEAPGPYGCSRSVSPRCVPYYEYRSNRRIFGLPLVHICFSHYGFARAKGIIAIGNAAVGVVAVGGCSLGLLSLGGISAGLLLALGGLSLGLFSLGGVAVGGFALGGLAVSQWMSVGGCALSGGLAVGGYAQGHVAIGDAALGTYALTPGSGISAQDAWKIIRREFPHIWGGIRGLLASFLS